MLLTATLIVISLNGCHRGTRRRVNVEYGITLSSIETTDGDTDRDKIPPMPRMPLLILRISTESRSMPARAGEEPLKKGEKCHQVLCRIGGPRDREGGEEDLTPMKEGRRNDRERIRGRGGGREGGREGGGDLSMEIGLRRSRRNFWLSCEGFVRVICRATTSGNV